ncbi:MAG: hypothetical protein PHV20_10895 [Bacteroidales bacterium]|nr:hypothetical protein [Bacteroidales bacterium]
MKKLIIALVIGAFAVSVASAQGPRELTPEKVDKFQKKRIEHLKSDLNLNEKQVKLIQALFDAQQKQMEEMHQNSEKSKAENREIMMKMKDERSAKMKSILTTEQFEKFTEIQKKAVEKMKEKRAERSDSTMVKEKRKIKKHKSKSEDAPVEN